MDICEYQGCEEEAKYFDVTDNKVCHDCMERELANGSGCHLEEDYELISDVEKGDFGSKLN